MTPLRFPVGSPPPQTPLGGPCSLYGATPSTGRLWRRGKACPFLVRPVLGPGPPLPAPRHREPAGRDTRHPAPGLQVPGAPTPWPHEAASHMQAPGGAGNTASPSRLLEGKSMNRCALFCRTSPSKTDLTATYFSWRRPSSRLQGRGAGPTRAACSRASSSAPCAAYEAESPRGAPMGRSRCVLAGSPLPCHPSSHTTPRPSPQGDSDTLAEASGNGVDCHPTI